MIIENKISKYLLYAVVEIVLVVIGILIALQINNWNENKKDRIKELFFLQKLTSNLNDDISIYKNILHSDSLIIQDLIKSSKEILSAQSTNDISFDDNSRFRYLMSSPNNTVYDNLISSRQIGLIRNDSIIDGLIIYYKAIEQMNKGTDESLKNYSKEIESFYMRFDHRRGEDILPKRKI